MPGPALRARASIRAHELLEHQPEAFITAADGSFPLIVVLASDSVPSAQRIVERSGCFGNIVVYDVEDDSVISVLHARPTPGDDDGLPITSATTFRDLAKFVTDGILVSVKFDGEDSGQHAHLERSIELV